MADLTSFLAGIKLSKYEAALIDYGVESTADLMDLDENDLTEAADECGMKALHKKKFLKGVKSLQSGGAPPVQAQPVQQTQAAPVQQYQAPVQAQAVPEQKEEKQTEKERVMERLELLAAQNTELHKYLDNETYMDAYWSYKNDRNNPAYDTFMEPYLNDQNYMDFFEQMTALEEKAEKGGEVNRNPLVKCSLAELNKENINAFRCKMGAVGFIMGDNVSANDDLIASNEFCQIAIGKRLVVEKDEDENAQEDEQPLPLGWIKAFTPDGRTYYQHLVTKAIQWDAPASDASTDENKDSESKENLVSEPSADIVHAGVTHITMENGMLDLSADAVCQPIAFAPGTRNFTLCMEVKCGNPTVPNAICANSFVQFFIFQSKVAVQTSIHELQNIGNIKLIPDFWYHISIVCSRKTETIDDGKEKGKQIQITEFTVYLDGVEAGIISLNEISNLDENALIGRTYSEEQPCSFAGGIQSFKLFYRDLSDDEVFAVAQNQNNQSYKPPRVVSYRPERLRVELPKHMIKYNGPLYGKLPENLQFGCTPQESLTITAYIMLTRANSKHGSIVVSNRKFFNGFELICPLPKTNVIGMKCSGTRDYDLISLGKTKLKINRFYHIGITISRENGTDTKIVAYLNGRQDGNYNIDGTPNLTAGDWQIGFKESKPIKTRFDGSIQNLRIFKYALSEAEIASIYAADLGECTFAKNSEIMYLSPKGSNNCPKCNQTCDFGVKFCSKCSAPVPPKSLLQFEKEECTKNPVQDQGKKWAQAFSDAAQTYVAQEYDISVQQQQNVAGQLGIEQKTAEQLQFEAKQRLDISQKHQTEYRFLEWKKGIFMSRDVKKGECTVLDAENKQRKCRFNEVIKPSVTDSIDAREALKIENIGGWIVGYDFHDNKFRLCTYTSGFVKYLVQPSCFNLLTNLEKFPKHTFEQIINNSEIRNYYVLNRLLFSAHELLKQINEPVSSEKKYWNFFNEYILPWTKIWNQSQCECCHETMTVCTAQTQSLQCSLCGGEIERGAKTVECANNATVKYCLRHSNFDRLKSVAQTLQEKYKQMQFELFDALLAQRRDWKIFALKNRVSDAKYEKNGLRQHLFDGGLSAQIIELDPSKESISADEQNEYDKMVVTMALWGRCFLLDQSFQKIFADMFEGNARCKYAFGPVKTPERMREKAIEYRCEDGKPFPASYSICDVNRCSVKCASLDDVYDAFTLMEQSGKVEVVRIKNRFLPEFDSKETGGYRDMLVNVLFTDAKSGLAVIAEVQFHLNAYEKIKHLQHKYYKIQRAVGQMSLLQNYEARKFDDKKEETKPESKDDK